MTKLITTLIGAIILAGMSGSVSWAQDAGQHLTTTDQLGIEAGIRLAVPLGDRSSGKMRDQATLTFAVSSTRTQTRSIFGSQSHISSDLLSIGLDDSLRPRLALSGIDLSFRTFPNIYANDPDSDEELNKGTGASTGLIVLGGLVVLGGASALIASEIEDDVSDGFRCAFSQIIGPEECEE